MSADDIQRQIVLLEAKRRELIELQTKATGLQVYWNDPVAWLHDCIIWPEGRAPADYQEEILAALPEYGRVSVRGPHGIGKTAIEAWAALWFATTRDGLDWKIPTTASWWRQLSKFLWPEIHKWAGMLNWERLGRLKFAPWELMRLNLRLRTGESFAVASSDPQAIEGAHADHLLYLYDEGKAIIPETYDASEGAFAGAGADTGQEALALAFSTPGVPAGRFFEIHKRSAGLEDWHVIHITLDQAIKAGRISKHWADQRAKQWGVASAVYQNRVLGEFATSDEDSIVPLEWVELANQRWYEWRDEDPPDQERGRVTDLGVDVARSGSDKTVIAVGCGPVVAELRRYSKQGTTETTGRVKGIMRKWPKSRAAVDVIGIGAGVVDQLREDNQAVVAFNASEGTPLRDRTGELGFVNKRAAAWWNMREMLDPDNGFDLALPPDDSLIGDLCAPRWRVMSGGRIQVESKDDIRKRLGRSTDDGDAVVMRYWLEVEVPPAASFTQDDMSAAEAESGGVLAAIPDLDLRTVSF